MVYTYPKCKNIVVDDNSKPYRDEVVRYLDLIATTDVGRTLYDFISKPSKTVRITWKLGTDWMETAANPYSDVDIRRLSQSSERIARERSLSDDDAFDIALKEDAIFQAKLKGVYVKDHPVMKQLRFSVLEMFGLHSTFRLPTLDKGTGEGADVQLNYHPAAWREMIKTTGRIGIGHGPGEALFHELVHGLRMMAGVMLYENVPERWNMDDFEEFCSILAANMYRSARGLTRLRLDHRVASDKAPWRGDTELPASLRDSKRYFEKFKPEIVKWFANQRDFCVALAGSCAPFNPMAVAAKDLGIAFTPC